MRPDIDSVVLQRMSHRNNPINYPSGEVRNYQVLETILGMHGVVVQAEDCFYGHPLSTWRKQPHTKTRVTSTSHRVPSAR